MKELENSPDQLAQQKPGARQAVCMCLAWIRLLPGWRWEWPWSSGLQDVKNRHWAASRTTWLFYHQYLPVKAEPKVTFVLSSALALRLTWGIVELIWRPVSHSHFFEFSFDLCCGQFTGKIASCCQDRITPSSSFCRLPLHILYPGQSLVIQSRFC